MTSFPITTGILEIVSARFAPHGEWERVETYLRRFPNSMPSPLFHEGYLGFKSISPMMKATPMHVTPAMPLHAVRTVISWFERGTASRMAYEWLLRTEIDDDATILAIREYEG